MEYEILNLIQKEISKPFKINVQPTNNMNSSSGQNSLFTWYIYNDKSFAVRGDRSKYANALKAVKGRWHSRMKGGPGWVIPRKNKKEMLALFKRLENEAIVEETCPSISPIKKHAKNRKKQLKYHRAISENEYEEDEENDDKIVKESEEEKEEEEEKNEDENEVENEVEEVEENEDEEDMEEEEEDENEEDHDFDAEYEEKLKELEKQKFHDEEEVFKSRKKEKERKLKSHSGGKNKKRSHRSGRSRRTNHSNSKSERVSRSRQKSPKNHRPRSPKKKLGSDSDSEENENVRKVRDYYKSFAIRPSKFQALYGPSEESSDEEISSSEYNESSDDFPSPGTPQKKDYRRERDHEELFRKIRDTSRRVYELELKYGKNRQRF